MRPTDEDLNLLMAQTLGYQSAGRTGMFAILVLRPGTDQPVAPPDFCNDRNALIEVWNKLGQCGHWENFMRVLFGFQRQSYRLAFEAILALPRTHVVAALKTLNQWPDTWHEE